MIYQKFVFLNKLKKLVEVPCAAAPHAITTKTRKTDRNILERFASHIVGHVSPGRPASQDHGGFVRVARSAIDWCELFGGCVRQSERERDGPKKWGERVGGRMEAEDSLLKDATGGGGRRNISHVGSFF